MFFIIVVGCSSTSNTSGNDDKNESADDEIVLKMATYFATNASAYVHLTEPWMDRVTELTNGKVQFETYPGEQLGKANDLLQLTKGGVADITVLATNYYNDEMPLTNMMAGLPNLHETSYQGTMAYNKLLESNEEFRKSEYLDHGVIPLFGHASPTYEIWSKEEIRVPKDMEGVRIRTLGSLSNEFYNYLGAVSVAVAYPELYEALERGVIEAASLSSVATQGAGVEGLVTHLVETHIGSAIHTVIINEGVWNSLPEDIQNAMLEASKQLAEESSYGYMEETESFNEEFSKEYTIVELKDEEKEQWTKIADEFTEHWLEKNSSDQIPYDTILEEYKQYLEEFK